MVEAKNFEKIEKLLQAVKKLASEIEYGTFTTVWKVHNGELKEFEVSEVRRKFKAE